VTLSDADDALVDAQVRLQGIRERFPDGLENEKNRWR
jgi:hypothetical protein